MPRKARLHKAPTRFDPKAFLAWLKGKNTKEYDPDVTVFAQGDPSDAVFYLEKGRVALSIVSRQGKEAVIATLTSHSFFGEACLNGQAVRTATAHTATPCTLTRIPKRIMLRALRENPEFSGYFVSYLLSRNLRVEEDLVDQLFNSSEKRLARLLLLLAHFGKDGKTELVVPRVNQGTLASMIGTTRERVSHFMNKFRRLGLIEYNGGLHVHSSLMQVVIHE
jgi:CRP/FNR family transcriptional regulator, cyclic AMP receptor protein